MIKPYYVLDLERRVGFLEALVKELNPEILFRVPSANFGGQNFVRMPRDPTPEEREPILKSVVKEAEVDRKRKIKYLVFSENTSKAYNWAVDCCLSSLDWILIQGNEWDLISKWYQSKAYTFRVVEIGSWRDPHDPSGVDPRAAFHRGLLEDNYIRSKDVIVV